MRPKEVPVTDAFVLKDLGRLKAELCEAFYGEGTRRVENILFADGHVAFFNATTRFRILRTRARAHENDSESAERGGVESICSGKLTVIGQRQMMAI